MTQEQRDLVAISQALMSYLHVLREKLFVLRPEEQYCTLPFFYPCMYIYISWSGDGATNNCCKKVFVQKMLLEAPFEPVLERYDISFGNLASPKSCSCISCGVFNVGMLFEL